MTAKTLIIAQAKGTTEVDEVVILPSAEFSGFISNKIGEVPEESSFLEVTVRYKDFLPMVYRWGDLRVKKLTKEIIREALEQIVHSNGGGRVLKVEALALTHLKSENTNWMQR
jgi:hypothetical protein